MTKPKDTSEAYQLEKLVRSQRAKMNRPTDPESQMFRDAGGSRVRTVSLQAWIAEADRRVHEREWDDPVFELVAQMWDAEHGYRDL